MALTSISARFHVRGGKLRPSPVPAILTFIKNVLLYWLLAMMKEA
jgi:hypothetical protein